MNRSLAVLAAATALAGGAGCSAVHKAESKSGCIVAAHAWYKGNGSQPQPGGQVRWAAVGHALEAAGRADTSAAQARFSAASVAAVRARTAALSSAVADAGADLPPACVTGVRARLAAALARFRAVGTDQNRVIKAGQAGDGRAALAAVKQADRDAVAGGRSFKAALRALRAYLVK